MDCQIKFGNDDGGTSGNVTGLAVRGVVHGKAVRARRAALGISQEELALRIGADHAYVSRIEAGRMNVTLETAQAIAAALDSEVAALLAVPDRPEL